MFTENLQVTFGKNPSNKTIFDVRLPLIEDVDFMFQSSRLRLKYSFTELGSRELFGFSTFQIVKPEASLPTQIVDHGIDLYVDKDVLSKCQTTFFEDNGQIMIATASITRQGYEGMGFATALAEIAIASLPIIISTYPKIFQGKKVYVIVIDRTTNNAKNIVREGWSSNQAKRLGFYRVEDQVVEGKPLPKWRKDINV